MTPRGWTPDADGTEPSLREDADSPLSAGQIITVWAGAWVFAWVLLGILVFGALKLGAWIFS